MCETHVEKNYRTETINNSKKIKDQTIKNEEKSFQSFRHPLPFIDNGVLCGQRRSKAVPYGTVRN